MRGGFLPRRGKTNQPGATPLESNGRYASPHRALKGRYAPGQGVRCTALSGPDSAGRLGPRGVAPGLACFAPSGQIAAVSSEKSPFRERRFQFSRGFRRAPFVQGDFAHDLPEGPFDLVVSNPPYVAEQEFAAAAAEVRDWEPRQALLGGVDEARAIASAALHVLEPGAALVLEAAEQRAEDTAEALRAIGYDDVTVSDDLAGRPRVVAGRAPAM